MTVAIDTARLAWFDALPADRAEAELLACCPSHEWAARMAAERPFHDPDTLLAGADRVWAALDPGDWLEAFAGHPRIGEREGGAAPAWSRQEQAGASDAGALAALREVNVAYEERFGHVFLIRAAGRSAAEMLAEARRRLGNDPATELGEAAEQQQQITRLRLERLLGAPVDVSTHVLDTARGRPAPGIGVRLESPSPGEGGGWQSVAAATTDEDGRARLMPPDGLAAGVYRLVFDTGPYLGEDGFYPEVVVTFTVPDPPEHPHVPLLLSPFGYTTYRGS